MVRQELFELAESHPFSASDFEFGTSSPAAQAGYPIINVPMGDVFGLPVGISFVGTGFGEPTLIKVASGFEAARDARIVPTFLPTLPTDQRGHGGGERRRLQSRHTTQVRRERIVFRI